MNLEKYIADFVLDMRNKGNLPASSHPLLKGDRKTWKQVWKESSKE
jgi:hypothetical protein